MELDHNSLHLSEKDYLSILDVIVQFNRCKSPRDLKAVFRSHLLPVLDASSGFYAWTDTDITDVRVVDSVNISAPTMRAFQDFIPYDHLAKQIVPTGRPVMAYDVDYEWDDHVPAEIDAFFQDHPKYDRSRYTYFDQLKKAMVALELPDPTIGIAIHRLIPNDRPVTLRDVRVLELLWPHLLHCIKGILLSEELAKYRTLADALANTPTAIALITRDCRTVFRNAAFAQLFVVEKGRRLPPELAHVLQLEMVKLDPPVRVIDTRPKIPFFQLPQGLFRICLSRLEDRAVGEPDLWLTRLKPALEPHSQLNKRLQDANLSSREIEVCTLIKQGVATRDIASRLFVSFETVRNHLKHIHQKLAVHSRAELAVFLNRASK